MSQSIIACIVLTPISIAGVRHEEGEAVGLTSAEYARLAKLRCVCTEEEHEAKLAADEKIELIRKDAQTKADVAVAEAEAAMKAGAAEARADTAKLAQTDLAPLDKGGLRELATKLHLKGIDYRKPEDDVRNQIAKRIKAL